MSSVVLDASFMVKLLVEEPGSQLSKAVFEAYDLSGARFFMPGHAPAEVMEVLRRKLNRGMVSYHQLEDAADILPKMAIAVPVSDMLVSSWSIATALGVTIYDALYVALADRRSGILVTSDIKLVERLRNSPYEDLAFGVGELGLVYYGAK